MSKSMTPERALEVITNTIQAYTMTEEKDMALAVAQKALKKQTPKKPNSIEKFRDDNGCIAQKGKCPYCNMIVIDYINGYGDVDSCFHCGQALDWSDEE